ncbi:MULTISPECIES: D-tagatose-bisphosphate aldolase, class II, non-catalytic subunit [unclassified Pseudoalteromonas]|uniref:D-tagatose-bisphosphate aldolase, class II, non-catalytic subunit n=1 Tax=unclassified Pseudoalteromonas TaxID=194690 RepID=UPI000B3C4EA8|nr:MULTISPECIES: D-tagatose-bisphosphate aldolase, class II, non-catalytic subunit [unclassified Pseudoalteromonas]MDN3378742.1 D-tagatose-bisphosphate aldolase, class II, non-catalytic subunit [Pseudoalteromonas sp. APC 3893]MDN3387230.1 D-tagatose-bisphosphate aldolase, class II, non-catalytic subunit [Pseudoalteromonas sp. APC 4017]OUS73829.1 D-tagatose-bisphosphate aldolase, class II, non-catalytic subunit [Pseudoalteromonas sp. A601]
MTILQKLIAANKCGDKRGIYAVCSAHPLVLEAAILQAKQDNSYLLIEATANQVNQFGGYTTMMPADFMAFVQRLATEQAFAVDKLILGGDHLGPVCWCDEDAEAAMQKAEQLIAAYVAAGFKKIHLDTSMRCADDDVILADETVAIRAAQLCAVAEKTAVNTFGHSDLVYVIGTEVPPPGGADEHIDTLAVTETDHVASTLALHHDAFLKLGLSAAWQRVVGLVVQPGVEFDNTQVFDYDSSKAQQLKQYIQTVDRIAFEAHSTDYQTPVAYKQLINDHFAILKVGPELTFALREALFALSHIEDALVDTEQCSHLRTVIDADMQQFPKNWQRFYQVDSSLQKLYRRFSFSDRIRYYWGQQGNQNAVETLFSNLQTQPIPLPLLSQYMPLQYLAIRNGSLENNPKSLVLHHIMQVTSRYADACFKQQ